LRVQMIDLRTNVRARWLAGVPMLLLGALLIGTAYETPQGLGTIIWGACLAVIAIVLIGERRFLGVDARSGLLLSKRGILFPITVASFVVADVKHIGLIRYTTRTKSDSDGTGTQRYKLVVNGRRDGVLADLGNQWQARRVGERLCVALNVPFDNLVYGTHSVRPPNELDMPVAERWQRAGEVHERPTLPAGSSIVVDEVGPNVSVSLPAQIYNLKVVAGMMLFFGIMGVCAYSSVPGNARPFLNVFFAMVATMFISALLAFSGRSRLTFSAQHVTFRQGRSLFSKSLECRAIEELIPASDGIDLVGDSGCVWIHWPETEADSEFLRALVAYELARRTRVVAADGGPRALR
jgi:hypothetical protein